MFDGLIQFIRETFNEAEAFIPLHAPTFNGKEKEYVLDTIDSTYVSSVGAYVDKFEEQMALITGSKHAIAMVNGTCALHIGLLLAGVQRDHEVISQPLTFVATANAISYIGAIPLFVDIDRDTLGLSPQKVEQFLTGSAELRDGVAVNKTTGRTIKACVPMHSFGLPCRIDELVAVCDKWNITVVEDAAESLGSSYKGQQTGTFGKLGIFSFNGNKTVTCGGGGAIVTDDEQLAIKAKHLTTTAKIPHAWEYTHDAVAYNYRMPNLNAALACAQLEQLEHFIDNKRELSALYHSFLSKAGINFAKELPEARSNYWLNAILLENRTERDAFLKASNDAGVMARPAWTMMTKLTMFEACPTGGTLENAQWAEDRLVNIPSSVRL